MRTSRAPGCAPVLDGITLGLVVALLAAGPAAASALEPRPDQQPSAAEAAALPSAPKCTISTTNPDVKKFLEAAETLVADEIWTTWTGSRNVWRNAWALDSLLDYFDACRVDPGPYATTIVSVLDPTKEADWWDDFGWMGIAALRAAERFPAGPHRDTLVEIAINSWTYMYGLGWSTDQSDKAVVPFTGKEVEGWAEFADRHSGNPGAPRVWEKIGYTWEGITLDERMERRPRFSPGGAWNSPITGAAAPRLVPHYQGDSNYLSPIQNTVTNGLYAILSLRLYQASKNPAFADVFARSRLNAPLCLQEWKNQILWLDQWISPGLDPGQSLLFSPQNGGILFRERVSTFHEWKGTMYWDGGYVKELAWTGDQGLLFGALREGIRAAGHFSVEPRVLKLYPDILVGVFKSGYGDRTYGLVQGSFLLPWLNRSTDDPFTALSPGGDDNDYQTGNAVFMRYLLQAYKADRSLVSGYKEQIIGSARNIAELEPRPKQVSPAGACDAYTPYDADVVTQMTPYVNRLSVLLLAAEMSR